MARTRNAPGKAEAMPGLPGPAEQLNDDLEPVEQAPLPPRRGKGTPFESDPDAPQIYRVWEHGTLQRDGKVHQPGDELVLRPSEAEGIPCLVR